MGEAMRAFTGLTRLFALCLGALALLGGNAEAQDYPNKPIKFIVCFAAGGPNDITARLFSQYLSEHFNQQFVVENRPGAGGNIGMEQGARAAPDGYTLTLAPVGNLTIAPSLYAKLPYDPAKDYAQITVLAAVPNVLIVHPSVQARTLAELIALAKAKPGTLNYASPGNGSGPHLAGELLKSMAGIDILHVPFNGVAPAMNAVLGGQVQLFFAQSSAALQHVRAGNVVALGVASPRRIAAAPDLPTIAEQGLPGFDVTSWYALVAPAGTPAPIIDRLHRELVKALAEPEVKERIAGLGAEPVGNTPAEYTAFMKEEIAKWTKVIKAAGITAQ